MCRSPSHSFESSSARYPTLVSRWCPMRGHSFKPHGVLSKSFSASWISGPRTIVRIHPRAFFHFSFCLITSNIFSQKPTVQRGNRWPSEPTGASIEWIPLCHPRSKAISRSFSQVLDGTSVFHRCSTVQTGVCFDKQDSGEHNSSSRPRGRSAATRSDTERVSAGIRRRIHSGIVLSC